MRLITIILSLFSLTAQAQSPVRIGTIASSVQGYDADAQDYFNRMATDASYTLTSTDKTQVNTLITGLKSAGTWTPYKYILLPVWANAAANGVPLKRPSGVANVIWNGTVTHATDGISSATSGYGDLGVSPSQTLTSNNGFTSAYVRTDASTGAAFGILASTRIALFARNGSNVLGDFYTRLTTASANARAFWVVARATSTDNRVYKNGAQLGTTQTTTGTVNMSTAPFYVLAINDAGTGAVNFCTQKVTWVGMGNPVLTATEIANTNTVVEAFMDARGIGIQ